MQNRLSDDLSATELKLNQTKSELVDCEKEGLAIRAELKGKQNEVTTAKNQISLQQEQQEYLKKTNANLLDRLSELSVINKTGAENMKKTLEALDQQGRVIKELKAAIATDDSLNLHMTMALNQAISNEARAYTSWGIADGRLIIQLLPQLFQASGEPDATLAKIAEVINNNPDRKVTITSFHNNLAAATDVENGLKRAGAVAFALQSKYGVAAHNLQIASTPSSVLNENIQISVFKISKKMDQIIEQMK
jgi:chemotaxis protein MotB